MGYIIRIVLPICIHTHKNIALGHASASFNGGAVAHGIRVRIHRYIVLFADIFGVICRAVVNHYDIEISV